MRSPQTIFQHDGYHMRSHSETRWARLMTAMGLVWLYEPHIIATRHGGYMPDFYLPAAELYVEVKGASPTTKEQEKAADVESATGRPVIIVSGDMELLQGDICHATLSHFGPNGTLRLSIYDLTQAAKAVLSHEQYRSMQRVAIKTAAPSCIHIGDAIDELFFGLMARPDQERFLRDLHRPLNAHKAAIQRQATQAEAYACELYNRLAMRRNQKDAA